MNNLSNSLEKTGRQDEAAALYTRVYEIGSALLPADHLGFQNARRNYARVLARNQDTFSEALAVLEALHRDQLKSPGPDYLGTLETQHDLGEVYEATGQTEQAAEVYASAAQGLARIHGPDNSGALTCAFRLVHLLHALGRKDEAADATKHYFGKPPDPQKLSIIGKQPSDLPR